MINIQDYNVEPHFGLRLAFHASETLFLEGSMGQADVGISSAERAANASTAVSNANFLDDRRYTDYHISLGWVALPGHTSFRGKTYIQQGYLIGGTGITNFANENNTTINFGAGYRLLINDNLAVRAEARDYIVSWDNPPVGVASRQHNFALGLGLSLFF